MACLSKEVVCVKNGEYIARNSAASFGNVAEKRQKEKQKSNPSDRPNSKVLLSVHPRALPAPDL